MKHKICTVNLSFQKFKNLLSSIKIQAEKGKNLKLAWSKFWKKIILILDNNLIYPKIKKYSI